MSHVRKKLKKRGIVKRILLRAWFQLRVLIDWFIDFVFGSFIYDDDKRRILPGVTNKLVLESATSLARKIRGREVTSTEVVSAFIQRIQEVNPVINAMVDSRFELALEEARRADEYIAGREFDAEEAEREKPFLGVPFTTKESLSCEGLSFSFGLLSRRNEKGKKDAEVVRLMKDAGAILLGVTNIPEMSLWCETRNNLFGQTLNPYNTTRTVGGSSGGEASLVASCGSPVGIGTDNGGSVRMPSFCCGLFGFKPTTDLTSARGAVRRTGEEKDSMVSAGTLTKYAEDVLPLLKVLAKPKLSLLALDEDVDVTNVRVFFMEDSGDPRSSRVCSELSRALRSVVDHFRGITNGKCREAKLDGVQFSYRLWRYWLAKEPYRMELELGNRKRKVNVLRELPMKMVGKSDFTLAALYKLLDSFLPKEDSEWAELTTEALRRDVTEILSGDSVLLYPSHPSPANYHYTAFLRPFNTGYWSIFNVLKLPVIQVPLGLSREGLPMGIQVVAALHKDHLCVAVAREIEKAFGGWVPPFAVD